MWGTQGQAHPFLYPTVLTRWPLEVRGASGPCDAPGGRRGGVPAAHLLRLLSQMQRGSGELQSTPTARSQPQPFPVRSTLHKALLTTATGLGVGGGPRAALRSPHCPPPSSTIVRGRAPSRCRALLARRAGAWSWGGDGGGRQRRGRLRLRLQLLAALSAQPHAAPPFPPPPPTPSFASRALSLSFYFIFSIHPPSFLHHQPPPPFPPGPHPNPRFLLSLIPASSFLPPRTAALRAVLGMK